MHISFGFNVNPWNRCGKCFHLSNEKIEIWKTSDIFPLTAQLISSPPGIPILWVSFLVQCYMQCTSLFLWHLLWFLEENIIMYNSSPPVRKDELSIVKYFGNLPQVTQCGGDKRVIDTGDSVVFMDHFWHRRRNLSPFFNRNFIKQVGRCKRGSWSCSSWWRMKM